MSIRRVARELEPSSDAVRRVIAGATAWRDLRDAAPTPTPTAIARLTRRVRPRPRRPWVAVAIAALALLLVRPSSFERPLQADVATTVPLGDVRLVYVGAGTVHGAARDLVVDWRIGTLALDVTPGRGVHLDVTTDEAHVRVHGTAFTVTRDALGTRVDVARGEVAVTCVGAADPAPTAAADRVPTAASVGTAVPLGAGADITCLPLHATGRLARARAQRAAGLPAASVLATLDDALGLTTPADPAYGELLAMKLDLLVSTGDDAGALAAADAYLAAGLPTRRVEVSALAGTLRDRIRDRAAPVTRP